MILSKLILEMRSWKHDPRYSDSSFPTVIPFMLTLPNNASCCSSTYSNWWYSCWFHPLIRAFNDIVFTISKCHDSYLDKFKGCFDESTRSFCDAEGTKFMNWCRDAYIQDLTDLACSKELGWSGSKCKQLYLNVRPKPLNSTEKEPKSVFAPIYKLFIDGHESGSTTDPPKVTPGRRRSTTSSPPSPWIDPPTYTHRSPASSSTSFLS